MTDTRQTVYTPLIDTTGRVISGEVTIELMPGIGVSGPNNEHMDRENGPHTVPLAFAAPLIHSRRARVVEPKAQADGDPGEEKEEKKEDAKKDEKKDEKVPPGARVAGAPSGVQQRDPRPRKRE